MHITQQAAPDISRKLKKKLALGPKAPTEELMEIAFSVYTAETGQRRPKSQIKAKGSLVGHSFKSCGTSGSLSRRLQQISRVMLFL